MKKTLLILSHPTFSHSTVNKKIIESVKNHPNISIRHLDSIYSDYHINIETEQKILTEHDAIILQFPLYWYHCPASLKIWLDSVFSYGFAFGSTGDKLKEKKFLISVTTGGPKESYASNGSNSRSVSAYLNSFEQISILTQMKFKGFTISHGWGPRVTLNDANKNSLIELENQINAIITLADS
ncbi:MAG: NAD(P)H-dependent oxidoreductase [Brevinema sp.]